MAVWRSDGMLGTGVSTVGSLLAFMARRRCKSMTPLTQLADRASTILQAYVPMTTPSSAPSHVGVLCRLLFISKRCVADDDDDDNDNSIRSGQAASSRPVKSALTDRKLAAAGGGGGGRRQPVAAEEEHFPTVVADDQQLEDGQLQEHLVEVAGHFGPNGNASVSSAATAET